MCYIDDAILAVWANCRDDLDPPKLAATWSPTSIHNLCYVMIAKWRSVGQHAGTNWSQPVPDSIQLVSRSKRQIWNLFLSAALDFAGSAEKKAGGWPSQGTFSALLQFLFSLCGLGQMDQKRVKSDFSQRQDFRRLARQREGLFCLERPFPLAIAPSVGNGYVPER